MSLAFVEPGQDSMARKRAPEPDDPIGPILFENLDRLGYVDRVLRSAEIAKIVTERTGRSMTRQRVSQLINAVRVNPETIALLAEGLGVKPSELTKPIRGR